MKLSISIMAVPQRRAHVEAMVDRLQRQISASTANVVGPYVFWDTQLRGPWHGWRGAWESQALGATHHAVIQDDIRFCADFPDTLMALIRARPDSIISGFLPRKSVEKAVAGDLHWVRTRRFLWAQCVILPTSLGREAMRWIDEREGTADASAWKHHDDSRLAAFFADRKLPVFVAVPHPVEHMADEIGGSVMGHNFAAPGRRARAWLGEGGLGAQRPWSDLRYMAE